MAQVRVPIVALDAPRRFHRSSCVGCECGSHVVSVATHSSMPVMVNGIDASPAAYTGSARRSVCPRSEEHTSELQSRFDLVCRLLLGKEKQMNTLSRIH